MLMFNPMELAALDVAIELLLNDVNLVSIRSKSKNNGNYKEYNVNSPILDKRSMVVPSNHVTTSEPCIYIMERVGSGNWQVIHGDRDEILKFIRSWTSWQVFRNMFFDAIKVSTSHDGIIEMRNVFINKIILSNLIDNYKEQQYRTTVNISHISSILPTHIGLNLTKYTGDELKLQCFNYTDVSEHVVDYTLMPFDNQIIILSELLIFSKEHPEILTKPVISCIKSDKGFLFRDITYNFNKCIRLLNTRTVMDVE